jgi:hypothetical protein
VVWESGFHRGIAVLFRPGNCNGEYHPGQDLTSIPEQLPSVLIIDDVASKTLDKQGSELFAELISRRYEKGSIIITTNRPFSEWPKLYDSRAAEEAVDKLVHHSTIIAINGPSYRLKEKLKLMESMT